MLTAFDSIPARDRVIVALDCDAWEAIALADKLEGHAKWLKIGMTLYYAEGPAIGLRPWPVAGRSAAAIRHLNARRDPVSLTSA